MTQSTFESTPPRDNVSNHQYPHDDAAQKDVENPPDHQDLLADLARLTAVRDQEQPSANPPAEQEDQLSTAVAPLPTMAPPRKRPPLLTMALGTLMVALISFSSYALGRLGGDLPQTRYQAMISETPDWDQTNRFYPTIAPMPQSIEEDREDRDGRQAHTDVVLPAPAPVAPPTVARPAQAKRQKRGRHTRAATKAPTSPGQTSENAQLSRMLDDVLGGATNADIELTRRDTPTRSQVLTGLRAVSDMVGKCGASSDQRLVVDITIHGPSGRVSAVGLHGQHQANTVNCVQNALNQARFTQFNDPSFEVKSFPYLGR